MLKKGTHALASSNMCFTLLQAMDLMSRLKGGGTYTPRAMSCGGAAMRALDVSCVG